MSLIQDHSERRWSAAFSDGAGAERDHSRRPLRQRFAADAQSVTAARLAVEERLGGNLDRETRWRVCLLLTELLANAVFHGSRRPSDPIALRLWDSDGKVRVEVEDAGPGFRGSPPRERRRGNGGFGLVLVKELADRWGITGPPNRVWFEIQSA